MTTTDTPRTPAPDQPGPSAEVVEAGARALTWGAHRPNTKDTPRRVWREHVLLRANELTALAIWMGTREAPSDDTLRTANSDLDAAAARCHAAAREAYLRSALRGEVHYLHHLAAHYADVARDPEAAVVWAQRDACIRRSGPSLSQLGWCLFRAGLVDEARAVLAEALSLGAGDPRLRARARAVGAGIARGEQAARDVLPGRKGGPR